MGSGAVNNFHVVVKQRTKFDGRIANEFLEWDFKFRTSLSVYNTTIFIFLLFFISLISLIADGPHHYHPA